MVSIDETLGVIKRDPRKLLDEKRILELCRQRDYWPEADGKLDPATVIALFMQQIAAGNVSCDQTRLMGHGAFSASGYCQARMRLPAAVISTLARETYRRLSGPIDDEDQHRWLGHRVLLMDATNFSMPDTPELQEHFGQPGNQVGLSLRLFKGRSRSLASNDVAISIATRKAGVGQGCDLFEHAYRIVTKRREVTQNPVTIDASLLLNIL